MDQIRKNHNDAKRALIERVVHEGQSVLDVGAGFGGDLQKWRRVGANVSMCDPSPEALEEARARARNMKIRVNGFYVGDIRACPARRWDAVCYNFSLHYVFETRDLFRESLREIRRRIAPGGHLFGIIPDSESIVFRTPLRDPDGNFFITKEHGNGGFGEKLWVHLVDTPFYADGPRPEPICYKDVLVTELEKIGFTLLLWEPLRGHISELYSKFIFVYKKKHARLGGAPVDQPLGAEEHGGTPGVGACEGEILNLAKAPP
jgi:SAM-dependent methyltransferase